MPTDRAGTRRCRFALFEVDFHSGDLRRAGVRVRLAGQPLKILELLLRQPGEVVTREEIRHTLWPADTFVDFEHNLNSAVKRLRAALGDSAETPRFIETLPRRGYRFLTPVVVEPDVVSVPDVRPLVEMAPPPAAESTTSAGDRRRWRLVAGAASIAMLGLAAWLFARGPASARDGNLIRSVAILPFRDLSAVPDQAFVADGLTETLTTSLAQIEPLRVVSHSAVMPFREQRPGTLELAKKLGVDALVDGSVMRDGDSLRITAQLIDGRTDRHLWAETYQGRMSDLLALQNRVARQIALEVNLVLSARDEARLSPNARIDPEVYEWYLRGRHLLDRNTEPEIRRALEYFERAVQRDPGYALGYAGVALAWEAFASWPGNSPKDAYPRAKAAALQALELDDSLVEALTCLAFILETYDKDFAGAERAYQRAIAINPNYARARQRYALHLARTGRNVEAVEQAQRARDLDPMSVTGLVSFGQALSSVGRNDEARDQLLAAIEVDPTHFDAYVHLAEVYQRLGRSTEAIAAGERAAELSHRGPHALQALVTVYARGGQPDRARQVLAEMERHPRRNPYDIALGHLMIGDREPALKWLAQACADRSPSIAFLHTAQASSDFDAVRTDPRFRQILACAAPDGSGR